MLERLQQLLARNLVRRPREGEPFDALGVGVLGGREAAAREPQLSQAVVDGLLDDLPVAALAGQHERVQVRRNEQRVVVEHLLEVRHEPFGVDGVAVEAPADEVVHAAGAHAVERAECEIEDAAPQQELDRRRGRKLRRAAEAAPLRVVLRAQHALGLAEQRLREGLAGRRQLRAALERLDE